MVFIFTDIFYLCLTLYRIIVLIASNLTEWCQNSKIILWGSAEFILNIYVVKHPRSHNLSMLTVRLEKNAGSESTLPKFYMNLCTQASGHRFEAIYNLDMRTPWEQHAALVSTAPEWHSGVRGGQLNPAWGGRCLGLADCRRRPGSVAVCRCQYG